MFDGKPDGFLMIHYIADNDISCKLKPDEKGEGGRSQWTGTPWYLGGYKRKKNKNKSWNTFFSVSVLSV